MYIKVYRTRVMVWRENSRTACWQCANIEHFENVAFPYSNELAGGCKEELLQYIQCWKYYLQWKQKQVMLKYARYLITFPNWFLSLRDCTFAVSVSASSRVICRLKLQSSIEHGTADPRYKSNNYKISVIFKGRYDCVCYHEYHN